MDLYKHGRWRMEENKPSMSLILNRSALLFIQIQRRIVQEHCGQFSFSPSGFEVKQCVCFYFSRWWPILHLNCAYMHLADTFIQGTFCKFIHKPLVKSLNFHLNFVKKHVFFFFLKSIMLTNAAMLSDQAYCVNQIVVKYNKIVAGFI